MLDYFINVGLSFLPYLGTAAFIVVIAVILPKVVRKILGVKIDKKIDDIIGKGASAIAAVIVTLGIIFALSSSANTFKLEHHDKAKLNQQIEMQNTQRSVGEIVDRSRKPELNTEERKERFDSLVEPYWKNSSQ